uniref:Uncharacterized protein n=1 Tax=Pipistrellus kuhlii TaxID=59472 RepID=A0A7J7YMJ6_PIPKU|nr:hypothetical protein mPipKuh1_010149 [Pipistrellus kuhlii]
MSLAKLRFRQGSVGTALLHRHQLGLRAGRISYRVTHSRLVSELCCWLRPITPSHGLGLLTTCWLLVEREHREGEAVLPLQPSLGSHAVLPPAPRRHPPPNPPTPTLTDSLNSSGMRKQTPSLLEECMGKKYDCDHFLKIQSIMEVERVLFLLFCFVFHF